MKQTIYAIRRHSSPSGETHFADFYIMTDNEPVLITGHVMDALKLKWSDKYDCVKLPDVGGFSETVANVVSRYSAATGQIFESDVL